MLRDVIFVIIGAIVFFLCLSFIFPGPQEFPNIISPLAESITETKHILASFTGSKLSDIVKNSLSGSHGAYAVVIKNLRTGEAFSQNEDKKFQPASLYKLWVMGTAYEQIKEGSLSLNEVLSKDVTDLNDLFNIPEDSAELTEGTITESVSSAIEQMITISNNYSAYLLVSKIRNSNIANFMEEQGFNASSLGEPPQTTAHDIALFFEKLYKGELIDSASSKEMLDLLSQQQLNDRIPKYLPDGTKVAHKTGEIDDFKHDAGIIYAKDPILFVVLSESDSPQGAAERIALLSRDVFNYFETK